MPIKVTNPLTSGGTDYSSPFVGPVDHTVGIPVLISGLTTAEVDAQGVLKPGVPLLRTGALVSGAGQLVYGVTVEAVKVASTNATADLAAAGTVEVAVALIAAVSRAIAEDNLGRAYSANEVAALAAAGSHIKLIA